MQRFLSTVGGGDESIGLGVQLSGITAGLITEVAPGGPADTAGLQSGDLVVAVDGQDISTADTPTLASTLVGPQGSTVKLTIDRGDGEPQTFVIARGPYYFPPLNSSVLPGGVGYVGGAEEMHFHDEVEILDDMQRLRADPSAIPMGFEVPVFSCEPIAVHQLPVVGSRRPARKPPNVHEGLVFAPASHLGLDIEFEGLDVGPLRRPETRRVDEFDVLQAMEELEGHAASLEDLVKRRKHHVAHARSHLPEEVAPISE